MTEAEVRVTIREPGRASGVYLERATDGRLAVSHGYGWFHLTLAEWERFKAEGGRLMNDPVPHFVLDGSVSLGCPDCDESVDVDDYDGPVTLGDILRVAREHKCEDAAAPATAGEENADA